MDFEKQISTVLIRFFEERYNYSPEPDFIQIQKTRKEFPGDFTIVVFPFIKTTKKSPEQTAVELGEFINSELSLVESYHVIKGFLNLSFKPPYWVEYLNSISKLAEFGKVSKMDDTSPVLVEFSSPNTNKPLHLGHIRNNLLGYSLARIIEANGKKVIKVNLVNDRGIHICKSMLAWIKWGNGESPASSGKKGDHLVGDYYVIFEKNYRQQVEELINKGTDPDLARNQAPLMKEAQEMLVKWERNDPGVIDLWKRMNEWVYEGFDKSYETMGVSFDKIYYESETYLLGKQKVLEALDKGLLLREEDQSVWIDLTNEGLDKKILLRSDGTSVYITQDIGTAILRHDDFNPSKMLYVVGNEQEYHFKVLELIMRKLEYQWSDKIQHISYGMVELPHGKMKSREGTVVDADNLLQEMFDTAEQMSVELGKLDGFPPEVREKIIRSIGLGALKYFILKVDPRKNMLFNPAESIDFNGNTGPFIQYTYARIQSVIRKASEAGINSVTSLDQSLIPDIKETDVLKLIYEFPGIVKESGNMLSPALIANYLYDLAKEYNQFYHDFPMIKEQDAAKRDFRLKLSVAVSNVIRTGMDLLGIDVPDRM
jgi:arginyl-tRNA synthetase